MRGFTRTPPEAAVRLAQRFRKAPMVPLLARLNRRARETCVCSRIAEKIVENAMELEQKIIGALTAELQRQSDAGNGKLQVGAAQDGLLSLTGAINLEELAMAIAGAVAGGP
jgi:hypothetical protein